MRWRLGADNPDYNSYVAQVFGLEIFEFRNPSGYFSGYFSLQSFIKLANRLTQLEKIIDKLEEVFRYKKDLLLWLIRPNPACDNKPPNKLLDNDDGLAKLQETIYQLQSGTPT